MPDWRQFWEDRGDRAASDYEFDRGASQRTPAIENLSTAELLEFIGPSNQDLVFDAGCGTGVNILQLQSKVRFILAMDYSESALLRCGRRLTAHGIANVRLIRGDVTHAPLPDAYADTVLCTSVLQYLNDEEVRRAFTEFARILKRPGTLILHVKNLSSLYLSTLWMAKRLLLLLGNFSQLEYFRPYQWYFKELRASGFEIVYYNSFNLLMLESMPRRLVWFLQKLELEHRNHFPFRTAFIRRHGSEFKIKAHLRPSV